MSCAFPATMRFLNSRKDYERGTLMVASLCIISDAFADEIIREIGEGSAIKHDPDPVGLFGFIELNGCLCKRMPEIIGNREILWGR